MIPVSLAASLALPNGITIPFLTATLVPMTVSSVLAALVLGGFIERELKAIDRERHWKRQASVDGLTGLANRSKFDRVLSERLEGRPSLRPSVALLILDADRFKSINDTCGHAIGDKVLREIAALLKASVGDNDLIARLGGEEFGIVLETRSPNRAAKIAENIRAATELRNFAEIDFRLSKVTVSIGCAMAVAGQTPDSLYIAADTALYEAKRSGRNKVKTAQSVHETQPPRLGGDLTAA
jgi:diguanylate cyclase (GGDEF)-like protein